jgi:hypothetical protein
MPRFATPDLNDRFGNTVKRLQIRGRSSETEGGEERRVEESRGWMKGRWGRVGPRLNLVSRGFAQAMRDFSASGLEASIALLPVKSSNRITP